MISIRGVCMHNRQITKKQFTYKGTSVALYFDPDAFSLMQNTLDAEATAFLHSTAANFIGSNQAFKSYYVHRVLKVNNEFHYVFANDDQAFYAIDKVPTRIPESFSENPIHPFNDARLLQSQEPSLKHLSTYIPKLEGEAVELFLAGKTTALKPAGAPSLQVSQRQIVTEQVAASIHSQSKKETMQKFLAESRSQFEGQIAAITTTEMNLESLIAAHTANIIDESHNARLSFYNQEIKLTREQLAKQKDETQKQIDSLVQIQTTYNNSVDDSQTKIVNNIIDNTIFFKSQLLAATHQAAYEIYRDIINAKTENRHELREQFNLKFNGFAKINKYGHLIYHGHDCLKNSINDLVIKISTILKNLNPNSGVIGFFSGNKQAQAQQKVLKDALSLHVAANAHYVKIEDDKISLLLSVNQLTTAETTVSQQQTKILDEASTKIKREIIANNTLGNSCTLAKEKAAKIIASLDEYIKFKRLKDAVDSIDVYVNQHKAALADLLTKALAELAAKSGNKGPNNPEVVKLREFTTSIQLDVTKAQTLLDKIARKKRELGVEITPSHSDIDKQHNLMGEVLALYVKEITGKDIDHANLHLLAGTIQQNYQTKIKEISDQLVRYHSRYQEYQDLLNDIAASKAQLAAIDNEKENPIDATKADLDASAAFVEDLKEIEDHNNLITLVKRKKSAIVGFRADIKTNLDAARVAKSTLGQVVTLTYDNLPSTIDSLKIQHKAFRANLDAIRTNKANIKTPLNEQEAAVRDLWLRNCYLVDLCEALVDIINDNTYWSQQVFVRGTRSPINLSRRGADINVPAGIAELQSKIAEFDLANKNWLEPKFAKELLTRFKEIAAFKVHDENTCCFSFFSSRKTTTRHFYNILSEINLETDFANTVPDLIRSLRNSLQMPEQKTREMRKPSGTMRMH